jgi:hypothetical protein
MPINQHRRKTATRADQQAAAAAHRADAGGIYIHQQERGLRGEEEHETVAAWQESGGSYSVKKCNKKTQSRRQRWAKTLEVAGRQRQSRRTCGPALVVRAAQVLCASL